MKIVFLNAKLSEKPRFNYCSHSQSLSSCFEAVIHVKLYFYVQSFPKNQVLISVFLVKSLMLWDSQSSMKISRRQQTVMFAVRMQYPVKHGEHLRTFCLRSIISTRFMTDYPLTPYCWNNITAEFEQYEVRTQTEIMITGNTNVPDVWSIWCICSLLQSFDTVGRALIPGRRSWGCG